MFERFSLIVTLYVLASQPANNVRSFVFGLTFAPRSSNNSASKVLVDLPASIIKNLLVSSQSAVGYNPCHV